MKLHFNKISSIKSVEAEKMIEAISSHFLITRNFSQLEGLIKLFRKLSISYRFSWFKNPAVTPQHTPSKISPLYHVPALPPHTRASPRIKSPHIKCPPALASSWFLRLGTGWSLRRERPSPSLTS